MKQYSLSDFPYVYPWASMRSIQKNSTKEVLLQRKPFFMYPPTVFLRCWDTQQSLCRRYQILNRFIQEEVVCHISIPMTLGFCRSKPAPWIELNPHWWWYIDLIMHTDLHLGWCILSQLWPPDTVQGQPHMQQIIAVYLDICSDAQNSTLQKRGMPRKTKTRTAIASP